MNSKNWLCNKFSIYRFVAIDANQFVAIKAASESKVIKINSSAKPVDDAVAVF